MRIIQNGYNQKRDAYDQAEFFICTHNYHPLQQDSERAGARPPAALASILLSMCAVSNFGLVNQCLCGIQESWLILRFFFVLRFSLFHLEYDNLEVSRVHQVLNHTANHC